MDSLKTIFEGKIDYQGQRLADRINQELLVLGAVVSLILGFIFESMSVLMLSFATFSIIAAALVIPAWPFYNRYETKWLPDRVESTSDEVTTEKKQN
ncbi:unnamed protein product [Sympodiomycopsis kandeliae]